MAEANKGLPKAYKDKRLTKYLDGAAKFTKGQKSVLTRYQQRAKILAGQSMGIGRSINNFAFHIKSIFNADALKDSLGGGARQAAEGAAKGGLKQRVLGFLGKYGGPLMMGALVVGMPLQEASKAEKGEKTKTFFHNFFGEQLGLFLGWEASRGLLRGTGLIGKLMGGRSLLRFMKVGSLGGFAAEMLAMFVLAVPFQKVGEKISNALFGEPKKKADPNYKPIDRDKNFNFMKNYPLDGPLTLQDGTPTPQEISQSFARTEHDKTANSVLADVNSRWKDTQNLVPIDFYNPGEH